MLQQWIRLKTHFELASGDERYYTAQILYSISCDMMFL